MLIPVVIMFSAWEVTLLLAFIFFYFFLYQDEFRSGADEPRLL